MVSLRHVEARDIEQLRKWRNDPRLNVAFRHVWPISEHQQIQWFESISQPQSPHLMFAIEDESVLIGCAGLCYIDWVHRLAEVSIFFGEGERANDAGEEAIDRLKFWAFDKLNLHKLTCEVFDREDWRIRYFKMKGMKEVGRFKEHRWINGEWVDSIILEIINARNCGRRQ